LGGKVTETREAGRRWEYVLSYHGIARVRATLLPVLMHGLEIMCHVFSCGVLAMRVHVELVEEENGLGEVKAKRVGLLAHSDNC
jgi:hypothetical protein